MESDHQLLTYRMSAQLVLLEHIQDQSWDPNQDLLTASQILVPLSQLDPLAEGAEVVYRTRPTLLLAGSWGRGIDQFYID